MSNLEILVRPLISYYGGKQRQAHNIVPLLPPHMIYVEPFAGGLAIFFAKGQPIMKNKHDYREVINDKDEKLINLYRVMQCPEKSQEFMRRLHWTPHSRAQYDQLKKWNQTLYVDDITKAWQYFTNIGQSFANTLNAGWKFSKKSQNHAATWNKQKQSQRLEKIRDRLASVYIECKDALDIIDIWDSPETLFYCDPPYPNTEQGHYEGYTLDDFYALVDKLRAIKGSFVLSCYHQDGVPDNWERFEFSAVASARKAERGQKQNADRMEVVWRNLSQWSKNTGMKGQQLAMW